MPSQKQEERLNTKARIRLTEESAAILADLLDAGLEVFWELRIAARKRGEPTSDHNRRIHVTKKIIEEVQRTREEAGWVSRSTTN